MLLGHGCAKVGTSTYLVGDSDSQPGYVGIMHCTDGIEITLYLDLNFNLLHAQYLKS